MISRGYRKGKKERSPDLHVLYVICFWLIKMQRNKQFSHTFVCTVRKHEQKQKACCGSRGGSVIFWRIQPMWNAKPGERLWLDLNRVTEERLDRMSNWASCTNVRLRVGPGCVMTITMEVWSPGPGPFLSLTWPLNTHRHIQTLFLRSNQETRGRTHI